MVGSQFTLRAVTVKSDAGPVTVKSDAVNFNIYLHVCTAHTQEKVKEPMLVSRAVAAAPQIPQLEGATLPKGAPIALKDTKLHQFIKKFFFANCVEWDFFTLGFYISILKFFAVVFF